jgi:hypothetical protein
MNCFIANISLLCLVNYIYLSPLGQSHPLQYRYVLVWAPPSLLDLNFDHARLKNHKWDLRFGPLTRASYASPYLVATNLPLQ